MKTNDRILNELFRASRAHPSGNPAGEDPAFPLRLATRWAAVHPEPEPPLPWEEFFRGVARGLAVLALVAGLTTWAGWQPVSAETDAVLESELLALLPSP